LYLHEDVVAVVEAMMDSEVVLGEAITDDTCTCIYDEGACSDVLSCTAL